MRITLDRASIGMADDCESHATQIELPEGARMDKGLREILRGPFLCWASDIVWAAHGPAGIVACITQTLSPDYQPVSYAVHWMVGAKNLALADGMALDFQPHLAHAGQLNALLGMAVETQTFDAHA